jgi:hypothetical protein
MRVSSFIILVLLLSSLAAFVAQLLIDFSTINITTSCIALLTALIISSYIKRTDAIQTDPLSTFAIFGFAITTQVGALLFQSLAWASLSEGLRQPIETFATLFVYLIVALVAHSFFRMLTSTSAAKPSLMSSLLERARLYEVPSSSTLWIMGWFGILAIFFGRGADVNNKVWDGFRFLIYAPFLIPIYINLIGKTYANYLIEFFFLALWFSLLLLFGMLLGTRGIIFAGIMIIALIYLLAGLRSNAFLQSKQIFKFSVIFVLILPLVGPASDLATAIQITRGSTDRSIENTISVAQKPYLLEKYRAAEVVSAEYGAYDEAYIRSPIFKRFVETKFHDNALYFSSKLSDSSKELLAEKTTNFLFGILPQPVLIFLKIDVDKSTLGFSMGDYLANLSSGIGLGSYKTGSVFAQGQALMGSFFIIAYFMICIALFYLMSLLCKKSNDVVSLSAPALLLIWSLFGTGISAESLHQITALITRNYAQSVLIYIIIYWLCRSFIGPRSLDNHKRSVG